jgi:hypothetical protein
MKTIPIPKQMKNKANKARQGTAGRSVVCFMAFPPAVPAL